MKYTVEGLSQSLLNKMGLNASDAVLLRWFWDFFPSMDKIVFKGEEYGWISYSHLIADLPILGIKNKDAVGRRLRKYVDVGLMKSRTVAVSGGGSKAYFKVTALWTKLNSSRHDSKVGSRHDLKVGPADTTQKSGDYSTSDPSANDREAAASYGASSPSVPASHKVRTSEDEEKVKGIAQTVPWRRRGKRP